jgi:hypothetical protein
MPVCRLIFRLDFKLNYSIIDHPGEVMRILWNAFENVGDAELRDNKHNRIIIASSVSEKGNLMKSLSVAPTSINGAVETTEGLEPRELLTDDEGFVFLTNLATQLCEKFEIDAIHRSGLRLVYFNKLGIKASDVVNAYRQLFHQPSISKLENKLGKISDCGIILDGVSDDGIFYHFQSGPYQRQNVLTELVEHLAATADFDLVCDLDLYENNFYLSNRQLSQLYRPLVTKAQEIIEATESELRIHLENNQCLPPV